MLDLERELDAVRNALSEQGIGEVLMLDLLLVTPEFEHVWQSRERHEWLGAELMVVSKQGLIALKTGRSSKLDLADIEKLQS